MEDLKSVEIINLTDHVVKILEMDSFKFKGITPRVKSFYLPSGEVARARFTTQLVETVKDQFGNPISITSTDYHIPKHNLPPEKPGVYYITSKIVAEILMNLRNDLLIVSSKFYDENGTLIGARGFSRLKQITPNEK